MEELMKDRIRLVMENQHQTQKVFANFIGMSEGALSSIFNGRTKPTLNIVEAIRKNVSRPIFQLFSGTKVSQVWSS